MLSLVQMHFVVLIGKPVQDWPSVLPHEHGPFAGFACECVAFIIMFAQAINSGYGKVYIHCWGGVGRTGTIVACLYAYLMKDEGLSADKLYELSMQKLHSSFNKCPKSKYRTIPETKEQCMFVRKFIENECVSSFINRGPA